MRRPRPDPISLLLLAAAALLLPALFSPSVPGHTRVYEYLFVVDISQSMLVRDYLDDEGRVTSRLDTVKAALIRGVRDLPCGSQVGLGLFTGWQTAVLFKPVEVCRHAREITTTIAHMDWRMTWAPQSQIVRGYYDALEEVAAWPDPPALLFITDGDEAPPTKARYAPPLPIAPGAVDGAIVGAGSTVPSPVPKYAPGGQNTGVFMSGGEPILSGLAQDYLQGLAAASGQGYRRLATPAAFSDFLRREEAARIVAAPRGIAWVFGVLALLVLAARFALAPRVARWNPLYGRRHTSHTGRGQRALPTTGHPR